MLHLTEDLLCIVLSKLCVKSVLRFRCVSKLWLNLIDSPYFVNLHLKNEENNSINIVILGNNDDNDEYNPSSVYTLAFNNNNTKAEAIKLQIPHLPYSTLVDEYSDDVHFCDSLICLVSSVFRDRVVIWNPATRRHREVVLLVENIVVVDYEDYDYYLEIGFGYDYKGDDYKVVMVQYSRSKEEYTFRVYSLKSNTWGRERTSVFGRVYYPVYADGALHWLGYCIGRPQSVVQPVSFDLATEQWCELQMPITDPVIANSFDLSSHGGSLCVTCYNNSARHVEFWVRNKQLEIINSTCCSWSWTWSKLVTIKIHDSWDYTLDISPIWNLNEMDRHKVLFKYRYGEDMEWYDIQKNTIEAFPILGVSRVRKSFTWYQSLVRV